MPEDIDEPDRVKVVPWRPRRTLDWLDYFLCGRGRYPKETFNLIIADAERLLNEMEGPFAYAAACDLCHPWRPVIDPSRPDEHWTYVKKMIAEHLNIRTGASGWKGI